LRRVLVWSRRHRRGSPTVEFILLVPFFILCLLLLWQLVILGMAVMHTQAAVRDVARVMALTNDKEQAEVQAEQSFPDMESYRKEQVWIETKDGQAQVKIKTEVDLVLLQVPYRFYLEEEASAPIIRKVQDRKLKLSGGSPIIKINP
jgi:ABC-type transport system involved in cytochrome bd biosynthesis fused ATPase/permease subunit